MADVTQLMADLHAAVVDLPPAEAPALLAQLGGVAMALSARLAGAGGAHADRARPDCLALAELAARLRLGQSTIRKMIEAGELIEGVHFTRIRRRLIFHWAAIEAWLQAARATPVAVPAEAVPFVRRGRRRG